MTITPVNISYYFEVLNHTMRAEALHLDGRRYICYYYDDKLVVEKDVPDGDFLKDDDIIRDFVDNYCAGHTDAFADIFNNHTDLVHLVKKTAKFIIENFGITINIDIAVESEHYKIIMADAGSDDTITGCFKANGFSDVLEKVRIFINTLDGINSTLSNNIDEFANDKVLEMIKWRK